MRFGFQQLFQTCYFSIPGRDFRENRFCQMLQMHMNGRLSCQRNLKVQIGLHPPSCARRNSGQIRAEFGALQFLRQQWIDLGSCDLIYIMSVILAKDSFAHSSDQKWPKAVHAENSPRFSSSGVLLVGYHSTDLYLVMRPDCNMDGCAWKCGSLCCQGRMSQAARVCYIAGDYN